MINDKNPVVATEFCDAYTEVYFHLKRERLPPSGAAKAYRESQSRIFITEGQQFVGAGEGADNLDFLADLSALKVINPHAATKEETHPDAGPIPENPSPLS